MFGGFLIPKYFPMLAKISGLNVEHKLFQKLDYNNP